MELLGETWQLVEGATKFNRYVEQETTKILREADGRALATSVG